MNRKSSKFKRSTQSSSVPSESDDAFAAAAAAAAAAASAADAATLSGWENPASSSSNRSVQSSSSGALGASSASIGGGSGAGGSSDDDQPDALSHSARLALSSSIRHHADLLRDTDQTIQGFDPPSGRGDVATDGVGGGAAASGNPFDMFSRISTRLIVGSQNQQQSDDMSAASSVTDRIKPPPPIPPPNAFMNYGSSSNVSASNRSFTLSQSPASMTPLYTLPKALLFRAVLAILSLFAALALAIFHGGGRLGLEFSAIMYEKSILKASGIIYDPSPANAIPQEDGGLMYDNSAEDEAAAEDTSSLSTPGVVTTDTLDIPDLESMNLMLSPNIAQNYAELTKYTTSDNSNQYTPDDGVPLFWEIPQSGKGVIQHILGKCFGVIEASDVAAGHFESEIQVFEADDGTRYVNVDTTTYAGLERATNPKFNLAASGLSDLVIFTSLLHPASYIFSPQYTGKLFTLFRHPVERVVSRFHHEQQTDMTLQDWTITQYAQSGRVENNWVTRYLVNKPGGGLTQDDVYLAMDILRRKCVVGLVDHIEESMSKFESIFGWSSLVQNNPDVKDCRDRHLEQSRMHKNPSVEEGSEAWNIIMVHNQYDYQVYKYAQYLFWTRYY